MSTSDYTIFELAPYSADVALRGVVYAIGMCMYVALFCAWYGGMIIAVEEIELSGNRIFCFLKLVSSLA